MSHIVKRGITPAITKLAKSIKGPNKNVLKASRKGAMHGMPKVRGGRSGSF